MTTTILLARHGETDWNREHRWQGHADPPLNERGHDQGRELARVVALDPPSAVYSSDLSRARETAEIVAVALGLGVTLDPRLREVDVGEWSGLTMAEVETVFPDGARRRREGETGWTTGEPYEAMTARVLDALHEIAAQHPGERVLVVTHGGPMRSVWAAAGEDPTLRPRFDNCAIEQIVIERGRIRRIDSMQGGGLHQQVQG